MTPITSKDDRKKQIVGIFKFMFGCTKVTRLKEDDNIFKAMCLKRVAGCRHYEALGYCEISKKEMRKAWISKQ